MPKVFIIILNFNGENVLADCLSSVFKSDYPNFQVVVVDNDSNKDFFRQLRFRFPSIHFIKNPKNFGFSKGNNVGIRFALEKFADYIFLLNNDTLIEKSTLSLLVSEMEKNYKAGIVSPLIFNGHNQVWFAGGKIDWLKMKTEHICHIKSNLPYESQYISGCAMLIRKEVFKKIGLLDERFFLYYEDADFSLRAKKSGFKLLIIPEAHIFHMEQSNEKNSLKIYWLVLSGLIFFYTNSNFLQKIWIVFYTFLRKIKNYSDLFFAKNIFANKVRMAYVDFKKFL